MTAAADGDRAAIDPLFAALWPPLHAYAARFVGDDALAEDAVQDALVKLFGQLDHFDRDRDALTWALTHVTWQCRTQRKRVARRAEDPEHTSTASYDGARTLEDRDLVRAALDVIAELSVHDRDTIATALGDDHRGALAPATFRKRLERALARFRTSWRSRHGTL